jgi:SAM-dependent methyltransferase
MYVKNKIKNKIMATPGKFDNETFELTRQHIDNFIQRTAELTKKEELNGSLLEIGSQDRLSIQSAFTNFKVDTLDIVDTYNPTFVGDITKHNTHIEDSSYDCIACLEVLEHTLNPFDAVKELRRILKHGGYLLASAPLNWRIHGPVPDCWRFTEFGWRVLLKDFDIIEIDSLETPDRELFPIKYNVLAKCNKYKNVQDHELKFKPI